MYLHNLNKTKVSCLFETKGKHLFGSSNETQQDVA